MNESLKPKPDNTPENKEGKKIRILFADDEEEIREMIPYFFEPLGYEVVTVSDGQELLSKFSKEKFDAVITDNNMFTADGTTEANGIDAIEQIKKEDPNLPVILLTGLLTNNLRARVERLNNSRCFEKPFPFDKLTEITVEMIEKSSII